MKKGKNEIEMLKLRVRREERYGLEGETRETKQPREPGKYQDEKSSIPELDLGNYKNLNEFYLHSDVDED